LKFITRSTGLEVPTSIPFDAPPVDRPLGETLSDAFRLESSLVSLYHAMDDTGEYDPEFNVMDHLTDENREYGPTLARAKNLDDFNNRWNRIQEELGAKQRLDQDGGYGTMAYMAAGILDPINLLPFGGVAHKIYKGGNILKGLVVGAEAGLAGTAATEAILQATQLTRTAEESALNIAAGTFLGGVLGGGLGAVKSGVQEAGRRSYDKILEDVTEELNVATGDRPAAFGTSVGAKQAKELPSEIKAEIDQINAKLEADVEAGKITEDQAAHETMRLVNDAYKKLAGFKETIPLNVLLKVAPPIKYMTPTLRSFMQASGVGREIAGQLMETGMQRAGSEFMEGTVDVPVESMIKLWEGKKYRARMDIRDAYYEYRTGKGEMPGVGASAIEGVKARVAGRNMTQDERMAAGLMTVKEFNAEVTAAMRNGDTHAIPAVDKLAKKLRKEVYDPIKDLAIEVGYLPEDIAVNPETAQSYLNRIWDIRKIEKDADVFVERLKGDFEKQAAHAAARMGQYADEKAALQRAVKALRAKRKDIETAVREGFEKQVNESAQEITEEALEKVDVTVDLPSAADKATAAEKAAQRAFTRVLRKELTEAVQEAVGDEIEGLAEEVIENFVAKAADVEEAAILATLREEIAEPLADAGKGATLDQLMDPAVYKAAEQEAALAANNAVERSMKAFDKRIEELVNDPLAREAAGRKKLLAQAKKEAREVVKKSSREALREATKDIDEEIMKAMDAMSDRAKQHGRDMHLVHTMDPENQLADDYVQTVMYRILGTGGIRAPHDLDVGTGTGKAGLPGAFRRRSLIVRDEDYADFLVSDPDELITKLIETTAPRLELRRAFGSDNFQDTEVFTQLVDDWKSIGVQRGLMKEEEALQFDTSDGVIKGLEKYWEDRKSRGKKFAEFHKEMERSIKDLEGVFERLKGTYKVPENPNAALNRISMGLRQTNFIRMMGGVVVSSIPDVARPMMTHGILKAFRSVFIPMLTDAKTLKLRSRDLHRFNNITDMVDNSRAQRIADIADPSPRRSFLESGVGTMSDTFGYVSGIAKWNDMLKTYAGLVSHDQFTDVIEKWVKHMENPKAAKPTKKEIAFLKDNFIDAGTAQDIWKQLNKHGSKHKDGFWLANIDKWDMVPANRFRAAMSREIDRTIVTPGQEMPLMASTPLGKLIFQFKSFQIAATEKMLLAGLQQNDINFYLGVMTAVGFGSLSYIAKEKLAGRDPDITPERLVAEGIDRSGIMGWLMEPNNFLEKASNGHIGIGPMVTGQQLSRYRSRNELGAALGPSFGTVQQLIETIGYGADYVYGGETPNDKQIEAMQRLLPYSNLFYLRMLMEATAD